MISFDLACSAGHQFEGWFGSSTDYEGQRRSGLLKCPVCDDGNISKLLSVPHIGRKGNQPQTKARVNAEPESDLPVPSSVPAVLQKAEIEVVTNNLPASETMIEVMGKLADMQKEVLKESKWVGRDFADEARAIHYGETEARQIHGEASAEEAEALAEEGVAVSALPFPVIAPDAKN